MGPDVFKPLRIIFLVILLTLISITSFAHTLPGVYNYLTVHPGKITFRMIISGIDMARLTGLGNGDLTPGDIGRLRASRKSIETRINQGLQLSQNGHTLSLNLLKITALPMGFELNMAAGGTPPIRAFTVQDTLLQKKNPDYQSFFTISKAGEDINTTHPAILDSEHPSLEWRYTGIRILSASESEHGGLFNLQGYLKHNMPVSWIFLGFIMAFILGIGHAFTPGHGKSLMAAYLVGHHGRMKDAFVMGLTTTITHTSSVILLGIIVMFFSHIILPSTLYPWVERISAVLIIITGGVILLQRIKEKTHPHETEHSHTHSHTHPHTHSHGGVTHTHLHPPESTKQAFWLAFSGGLVPCPSALAVLFAAIAMGRIGYGILMLVVFSLGLGGTLVLIGIAILKSRTFLEKIEGANRIIRHLDLVGPAFIMIIGILFLLHGPFGALKI
jgi:ABC-type nickel/cobalt efflux system permease component RcnA